MKDDPQLDPHFLALAAMNAYISMHAVWQMVFLNLILLGLQTNEKGTPNALGTD